MCSLMDVVARYQTTSPSNQSYHPSPINQAAMSESSRPSQRTPNARGAQSSQQQNQLPTPPDSNRRTGGNRGDTQGERDQPVPPGGGTRRYMNYPDLVSPHQQQPAPYQSNGRRRRRTQVELCMFHALAWLGYGEAVPNVSVVTGQPLVDGEIPTHGTWELGGEENHGDVDDLAVRVSRSLTIATNRNAAEEQRALKRGGA